MADFCKECSEEMFGADYGDLAGISTAQNTADGLYACVLCEGCGPILVDHRGLRVERDNTKIGEENDETSGPPRGD